MAWRQCDRCSRHIWARAWQSHQDYHGRQDRRAAFETAEASAELDKEGIVVSGKNDGIDFGIIDSGTESSVEVTITIQNTTQDYAFRIATCRMRSSTRSDENGERFSARVKGRSSIVRPGNAGTRTVSVVFHPGYAGQFEDTLELVFWHLDLHHTFVITRRVKATIGDRDDHEEIKPQAPYTGPRQVPRFNYDRVRVVLSLRPPTWTETVWTERLPEYKVPEKVVEAAFGPPAPGKQKNPNAARANVQRLMPAALNLDTYAIWWQVLLWVEEEQVKQDLDHYALEGVELKPNYPRYEYV